MKNSQNANERVAFDKGGVIARLEDAMACAEEIKHAAKWEWAVRMAYELSANAKVLRNAIQHSDAIVVCDSVELKTVD